MDNQNNEYVNQEVTVPLKVEELKRFIENKEETFYHVNYGKSDIDGGVFFNYLSNLELPCDVILEDLSFEEKEKVIKAYMGSGHIVSTQSLAFNVAIILLKNRGIDTDEVFENPLFNDEEAKKFIENNKEMIDKWEHFIESSIVYALYITKEVEEENDIKSQTKQLDDSNYVGLNIVNLFQVPFFLELFFLTGTRHELTYFTRQFEEYMFKGKNFYEYFFNKENHLFALFLAQLSNDVDNELLNAAVQE